MQKVKVSWFNPSVMSTFASQTTTLDVRRAPIYQRLLDLTAALIGSILLLLIMPWIWLANRWWAPGPLFYRQRRV